MELPSLRHVLTEVLKGLESHSIGLEAPVVTDVSFRLESLPPSVQTSLLVLHQIYPQLLLSSLDLLDNTLATRYILTPDYIDQLNSPSPIYYVRSSQTRSSRYAGQNPRTVYEVRPAAWHCTCPAFTFSAFSSRSNFDPFESGEDDYPGSERWGGEMRGGQLAICKHLLAILIGERLKVIPEKQVDLHTLANYAFGEA
jgi:hypothetical protein